ncbi:MAG: hypothetical protein RLZZ584_889 [Pseudomonadota bacterium]|jgi:hypothetical protein
MAPKIKRHKMSIDGICVVNACTECFPEVWDLYQKCLWTDVSHTPIIRVNTEIW